ncbi:ATP-binding protein [Virgisporangium aliadipatigenens]|uniref:ATP-binding protein n=1 Tax=Virgisporangium aliadipatigenens TaxID=741659 RepID=UPI001944ADBE|nr:ATP-binding protein [Virgisporangium aliadipatigenens]
MVLVVEDNPEHQRVIAETVRRLGHRVVVADDGRSGLAAVRTRHPDLVITDVDMPEFDGLELCRAIRGCTTAAPAVIAITAFLMPGDPSIAAAGAATVVRKPFTLAELGASVRAHLPVPSDATDADRPPAADVPTTQAPAASQGPFATTAFVAALLQSLDTGVAACGTDGRLVVFNAMMQELFGTESLDVLLDEWPDRFTLCHHDGTPLRAEELPLRRALGGQEVCQSDLLAYDRAGQPRWFTVNARPIQEPGTGTTIGAVAAVHDITDAHRTQRYQDCETAVLKVLTETPDTVAAGNRILTAIATTLDWPYMALWLVDPVVDRLRRVAVYAAEGEAPLPVPETFGPGESLPGVCWQRGEPVWAPDIHAPDSPVLPAIAAACTYKSAGAVPVRSGERTVGVLVFFAHDRQEPEPALAILISGVAGHIGAYLERRRAEELSLQLAASTDEYVALVGHELRTPLTSIAAYTELIAESPPGTPVDQVRDLLDVVLRNTAVLRTLVEQLLDLAALDSGHVGLECAPVDLAEVVGEAVECALREARPRDITIDSTLHTGAVVTGDRDRLRQVVDCLLGNAVKYSPDGSAVTVGLVAGPDCVELTVADNGIGVPEGERSRVFQRLYRASNARHSSSGGNGLGLALSRTVVERHHGSITLASTEPSGTLVTVRLPDAGCGAGSDTLGA